MLDTEPITTTSTAPEAENATTDTQEQKDNSEQVQPEQTTSQTQEHKDDPEQTTSDASEQKTEPEEPGAIFQAVGVITGKVQFIKESDDKERTTITIGNKEYPLFYISQKKPHRAQAGFAI